MDWIWKNKEWLFSGAALVLITALWRWIPRVLRRCLPSPPPFDQAVFRARPHPREIVRDIEAAPPIHRTARGAEILSLSVQWRTTLDSATATGNDGLMLMLLDRGHYPWICSVVPKSKYPDLLLAKQGTTIWIAGRISKYESNVFEIAEPQLQIIL